MQTAARARTAALDNTLQQLWGAAVASGEFRLRRGSPPAPGWEPLRRLDVFPTTGRASMVVERSSALSTAHALMAYQGLRPRSRQVARLATAAIAGARAVGPGPAVVLDRRITVPTSREPLTAVGEALGHDVHAHIGVRRGANAKATAQLFAPDGTPVGYAKFAWNELTASYVRTEARRLAAVDGRTGRFRTPHVLARGEVYEQPFLVTAPLPHGVRRLARPGDLGVPELARVAPLERRAPARTSAALVDLCRRTGQMTDQALVQEVAAPASAVLDHLMTLETTVPIAQFDHGDLVPWNTCRAPDGTLWAWDWESSVEDVVAGTDALHWFLHAVHGPAPTDIVAATREAHIRATPTFRAIGMSRSAAHVATAVFALATAERACALARSHGTWARNRVGVRDARELVALAQHHADGAAA